MLFLTAGGAWCVGQPLVALKSKSEKEIDKRKQHPYHHPHHQPSSSSSSIISNHHHQTPFTQLIDDVRHIGDVRCEAAPQRRHKRVQIAKHGPESRRNFERNDRRTSFERDLFTARRNEERIRGKKIVRTNTARAKLDIKTPTTFNIGERTALCAVYV